MLIESIMMIITIIVIVIIIFHWWCNNNSNYYGNDNNDNYYYHYHYWHNHCDYTYMILIAIIFIVSLNLYWNIIFSCDQAALQMVFSVCLSVCLSVCPSVRHTFFTMFPSSYHHEIFRSYYQWQKWRPCKRSRSEVKGQGHRGHKSTLPFPDCNSSLNSPMTMKWCI